MLSGGLGLGSTGISLASSIVFAASDGSASGIFETSVGSDFGFVTTRSTALLMFYFFPAPDVTDTSSLPKY